MPRRNGQKKNKKKNKNNAPIKQHQHQEEIATSPRNALDHCQMQEACRARLEEDVNRIQPRGSEVLSKSHLFKFPFADESEIVAECGQNIEENLMGSDRFQDLQWIPTSAHNAFSDELLKLAINSLGIPQIVHDTFVSASDGEYNYFFFAVIGVLPDCMQFVVRIYKEQIEQEGIVDEGPGSSASQRPAGGNANKKKPKSAEANHVQYANDNSQAEGRQAEPQPKKPANGDEPLDPNPNSWNVTQVSQWVRSLGDDDTDMSNVAQIFRENRVRGEQLFDLDKSDLREMGITAWGDVKFLLKKIGQLSNGPADDGPPPPPAFSENMQSGPPLLLQQMQIMSQHLQAQSAVVSPVSEQVPIVPPVGNGSSSSALAARSRPRSASSSSSSSSGSVSVSSLQKARGTSPVGAVVPPEIDRLDGNLIHSQQQSHSRPPPQQQQQQQAPPAFVEPRPMEGRVPSSAPKRKANIVGEGSRGQQEPPEIPARVSKKQDVQRHAVAREGRDRNGESSEPKKQAPPQHPPQPSKPQPSRQAERQPQQPAQPSVPTTQAPTAFCLYVKNLPENIKPEHLNQLFGGRIKFRVHLSVERKDAYLEYHEKAPALEALKKHGMSWKGKTLQISKVREEKLIQLGLYRRPKTAMTTPQQPGNQPHVPRPTVREQLRERPRPVVQPPVQRPVSSATRSDRSGYGDFNGYGGEGYSRKGFVSSSTHSSPPPRNVPPRHYPEYDDYRDDYSYGNYDSDRSGSSRRRRRYDDGYYDDGYGGSDAYDYEYDRRSRPSSRRGSRGGNSSSSRDQRLMVSDLFSK